MVIRKIDGNVEIIYDKEYIMPDHVREKVEAHWEELLKSGKSFTRGTVFTISNIESIGKALKVYIQSTDYAHYLYTIHNNIEEYGCRVIYVSILVETIDSSFIIGEMACNTALPNRLQCCGGGFDDEDLIEGKIDIYNNIQRELYEELGINLYDTDIVCKAQPKYIQSGGEHNFIGLVFKVELKISEKEYIKLYKKYIKKLKMNNVVPEFKSLVFIKSDSSSVKDFFNKDKRPRADYLEELLMTEVELY
ncbi:NUDIX hydrolase [Clostridium senegalense]|uniref:NUDIX hydrolase n=1 Tax=Clostridium senegalense TaxID=1465809 RepID=UPI0002886833|nr:NUDIX hydrolase [Clostridium senegalense]